MLAAVFGAERFHTYVYGWSFTIESDHKPLESISRKNLADTPAWLQCMMLCLQGYDFTILYHPGKEMVIPDMLSWFSPRPGPDLPLDIAIHHARWQRSLPTSLCEWPRNASSSQPHHHWLAWGHQGGPSSPYIHTGNTEKPSPLRMAYSCEVKPLSFLLPKGRESCINCINSIKE